MKGILMTPDNAQKCHDGTKTQTRRVIKLKGWNYGDPLYEDRNGDLHPVVEFAPYSIGEHVYIKEAHYRYGHWNKNGFTKTGRQKWAFKTEPSTAALLYANSPPPTVRKNSYRLEGWYKRPSLFLPADLARTIVEITDIRAQRVQDISWSDAVAEGIVYEHGQTVVPQFQALWDSIHGEDAWDRNEYCWAYSIALVSKER